MPTVAFVTVFFIIPLLMTVYMSFHDWPLFGERAFTGLENYQELGKDRQYLKSLDFTFRYTALVTPPIFILGFILASSGTSEYSLYWCLPHYLLHARGHRLGRIQSALGLDA